jgi:hypothetical protein
VVCRVCSASMRRGMLSDLCMVAVLALVPCAYAVQLVDAGQLAGLEPFSYDQLQPMEADHSGSYRPFGWNGDGSDSMTENRAPGPMAAFPFQPPSLPPDFRDDLMRHHGSEYAQNPRFREVFEQPQPHAPQMQQQQRFPAQQQDIEGPFVASDPNLLSNRPITPAMVAAQQQAQQAKFLEEQSYMYRPSQGPEDVPSDIPSTDPNDMDPPDAPPPSDVEG